jgi:hypothetical protein
MSSPFVCLTGAARWPLFSPPGCRQPRGSLPGWRRQFFLLDWPALGPRATKHEAAHEEAEAVAGTAVAACARAVWSRSTSHIAAKAPCGRPRPHIYWVVQPFLQPRGGFFNPGWVWLDGATIQFRFFGHNSCYTGSFCVFGPVLSSPAHGSSSLTMDQI